MSAKNKGCFQITRVTQAQVATVGCADDAESLNESQTKDGLSEIHEPEVVNRKSSAVLNSIGEDDAVAHRAAHPGQSHQPGGPGAAGGPGQQATITSRFRVIKLDHDTVKTYRRGRWTCTEYYDPEPEVVTGRTAERTRYTNEQAPDRDSGLGASVVVQTSQPTDVMFTNTALELPASLNSVHPFEPGNDPNKMTQPAVPTQALTPELNQGSQVQVSPVSPQAYQNQLQQNPQLPLGLHMPGQTSMMAESGQQHLPHVVPMQGEIGISIPASQTGASVPASMDRVGVMTVDGMAPLTSPPSEQVGQYSGVAMTPDQNSPALSGVGTPVPEEIRRKSEAAASAPLFASVKEAGKPTEELPHTSNPGVNNLFDIHNDGDEDSASGASVIAIDDKIEQAMDLVKSHLMYAVREEVEVLKEQIKELCERNAVLEHENAVLKSLANSEQLSQLSAHMAAAAAAATTAAAATATAATAATAAAATAAAAAAAATATTFPPTPASNPPQPNNPSTEPSHQL